MNLSENEKQIILRHIQEGQSLPKEYIYKLFADDEDVFLFWNGRKEEITNSVLPFHSIEHIDEARMELAAQTDLFSIDAKGRQDKGWTNKLIWGDNKLNVYINKYLYIFVKSNHGYESQGIPNTREVLYPPISSGLFD